MARGEGVDEPRFAAGLAERPLDGPMIHAGHFDGDDVVAQAVFLARFLQLERGDLGRSVFSGVGKQMG